MGGALLRSEKQSTLSKTEAQKKTVRSPKMYEPPRPQLHSSCWFRVFHSHTRMHIHICTQRWLALPQSLVPQQTPPVLLSLEIHRCSHTQSWPVDTHSPSLLPGHFIQLMASLAWSSLVLTQSLGTPALTSVAGTAGKQNPVTCNPTFHCVVRT